ncbi:MAG: family 1 glycosylhydrolase [Deltaproteobacteria bacterium]|nr:family 1 glycosylhydrolase [Deltaproteobacteria bacterium]
MKKQAHPLLPALLIALSHCTTPPPAGDASPPDAAQDAMLNDLADGSPPDAEADGGADAAVDATPAWLGTYVPGTRAPAGQGFLWGSATAGYQIEGQLENTDWRQWERMGRIVGNGQASDGPRSYPNFMPDVEALRASGQTAYRFGVEWARLFPTAVSWEQCRMATGTLSARVTACRAAANSQGKAYYHGLIDALRASTPRITPMVTIHHWVMPDYIADPRQDFRTQGWMNPRIRTDMALLAAVIAGEFGDSVDWYVTLNEPLVLVLSGYLDGRFPPGRSLDFDAAIVVLNNMIYAHAMMYDNIKAMDTTVAEMTGGPISPAASSYVSIAHHMRRFFGANPTGANDARAAAKADWLNNRLFFEAIVNGNLDADGSGVVDPTEPRNDAALRNRVDYLGVNYYGMSTIRANSAIPLLGGLPEDEARDRGLPKNDFGWDVYPRGFEETLTTVATLYNRPIVITENGMADSRDVNRRRFMLEHIGAMLAAKQRGANIVGYFHWSLMDNFEWVGGYCPHFGLFSVDFSDPMRTRVPRPSVMLYQQIIRSGTITDAQLAAAAPYVSPPTFCNALPTMGGDAGTMADAGR